jgi:putative membrane protein
MGLANLVPGISGGTMLLATGVYTRFVQAVAEVTTLRFRLRSIALLATIAISAVLAIILLAGPVRYLVTEHRWIMYSIFIGLTLGGVPLVLRMARPLEPAVYGGALVGFMAMALMAFSGTATGSEGTNYVLLAVAGVAGASAMILPGVSGAYLLLVLGQYETILGAIDQCKRGLGGEPGLLGDAMHVVVPVAIGVLVGVVGVSNLVRWALKRHEKATLGVLLRLLFGSVLGFFNDTATTETAAGRVYFAPTLLQVLGALGLAALGYGLTLLIDRLGATEDPPPSARS